MPMLTAELIVTINVKSRSWDTTMRLSYVIALMSVILLPLHSRSTLAAETVSEYLEDGWEIKAITQISSVGYTQIILQKGTKAVICTIYYTAKDNRWTTVAGHGCDPVP
jgi:hypothetical protein